MRSNTIILYFIHSSLSLSLNISISQSVLPFLLPPPHLLLPPFLHFHLSQDLLDFEEVRSLCIVLDFVKRREAPHHYTRDTTLYIHTYKKEDTNERERERERERTKLWQQKEFSNNTLSILPRIMSILECREWRLRAAVRMRLLSGDSDLKGGNIRDNTRNCTSTDSHLYGRDMHVHIRRMTRRA